MVDGNNDATGPFSVPRVSQIFNYNSNYFLCHDAFCDPQEPRTPRPIIDMNVDAQQMRTDSNALPDARFDGGDSAQSEMQSFRFGLPQVRLRSPESMSKAPFSQPLDRHHMLVFERFLFQRTLLVVLAMEGQMRFIQPWSHGRLVAMLKKHGIVFSPVVPTVAH